ncbi:hypothetical protein ACROYT_G017738 [Oculina patagonica]
MEELRLLEDASVKLDTADDAVLEWMEVGQLGVHGILVVKVVEKVSKNAGEAAQNRRLEMVVNLALVHPNKIERVTRTIVQYTVVGQVGVVGLHAVNPVQLVFKNVPETVRVHLQVTAETIALEMRGKIKRAANSHAL